MSQLASLYAVRLALAAATAACLDAFRRALEATSRLGPAAGWAFAALACTQFHLPFYASRTLPNTWATCLVSLGAAHWLRALGDVSVGLGEDGRGGRDDIDADHASARGRGRRRHARCAVALLAAAAAVFRCDMLPLAALVAIHLVFFAAAPLPGIVPGRPGLRVLPLLDALAVGAAAAAGAAGPASLLDSALWGRATWPELEVLLFNTAENRSAEWGTQPWHWYFTSALPRALGPAALLLAPAGAAADPRLARPLACCAAGFAAAYSLLPHKELRFLLPVLPLLDGAAAVGLAAAFSGRRRGGWGRAGCLGSLGLLAASGAAAVVAAMASAHNYPGGKEGREEKRRKRKRAERAERAERPGSASARCPPYLPPSSLTRRLLLSDSLLSQVSPSSASTSPVRAPPLSAPRPPPPPTTTTPPPPPAPAASSREVPASGP